LDQTGDSRKARSGGRAYGRFDLEIGGRRLRFDTQPGVFSHDGPDEGTLLLLGAVLPTLKPHQKVLDLGCGVGLIGLAAAGALARGEVWMVDSDVRAVRLTEQNIRLNGVENAHVILGDVTVDLPPVRFDLVLSNPPTHSGKDVIAAFVGESYEVLRPGGRLYLVVNRLLSVKNVMGVTFGNAEQVERRKGFIVLRAEKERVRAGA
jgi:16S rRNA (guanine1207-N2)-methyltransferase